MWELGNAMLAVFFGGVVVVVRGGGVGGTSFTHLHDSCLQF